MFGQKLFTGVGYPTPDSIPDIWAYRPILVPSSAAWLALLMGLMLHLVDEDNWQQYETGISREDAAATWLQIVDAMYVYAVDSEMDIIDADGNPLFDRSNNYLRGVS